MNFTLKFIFCTLVFSFTFVACGFLEEIQPQSESPTLNIELIKSDPLFKQYLKGKYDLAQRVTDRNSLQYFADKNFQIEPKDLNDISNLFGFNTLNEFRFYLEKQQNTLAALNKTYGISKYPQETLSTHIKDVLIANPDLSPIRISSNARSSCYEDNYNCRSNADAAAVYGHMACNLVPAVSGGSWLALAACNAAVDLLHAEAHSICAANFRRCNQQ